MYLHNPDNGATIGKRWIDFKVYFEDKPFAVGDVINVEDEVGKELLAVYEFLLVVDEDQAKAIYADQKHFECSVCGKKFQNQLGLTGHSRTHEKKTEAGIPIAEGTTPQKKLKNDANALQRTIEADARENGLTGEGLIQDNPVTL